MAKSPFKMKGFSGYGNSPMKQSVQDNTRTNKAKEVTIEKWNAENAWKLGDKDKFDNQMTQEEHKYQYDESVKRIDAANKKLTIRKFTDKEKQKIINKDLRKHEDNLIRRKR